MLVQLVYVSRPTVPVESAAGEFVPLAMEKNDEHDISGLVLAHEGYYLQLIEGERERINQLYTNLVKDERHECVTLLRYTQLREREFGDWSMAYITTNDLGDDVIQRLKADQLDFKIISSINAMVILRRIAALLRVEARSEA
jgi:hypothetical protein